MKGITFYIFYICIFLFMSFAVSKPSNAFEVLEDLDFDISSQDDVYQAYINGSISEEVAELLIELLENPIELNSANEIEIFSLPVQPIDEQLGGKLRIQFYPFRAIRAKMFNTLSGRNNVVQFGMTTESWQKLKKLYVVWQPNRSNRSDRSWYLKKIVLGNYSAGFGSGLTFNEARRVKPDGIYPDYTFSYHRQRGIALQTRYKSLKPTIFTSYSNFERLAGLDISATAPFSSEIGLTWYSGWHSEAMNSTPSELRLSAYGVYGVHFKAERKTMRFRAEATKTTSSNLAIFTEMSSYFNKGSLLVSFRKYGADFINPHSYSYADADDEPNNRDELGMMFQVKYELAPNLKMFGFYDQWRHPSSNISENRGKVMVKYELSESFEVGVSTKMHDENILTEELDSLGQLTWIRWQPIKKLALTSTYNYTNTNSSYTDDYVYLRVEWKMSKWLRFQGQIKVKKVKFDGHYNHSNQSHSHPVESYFQIQVWDLKEINGRMRYKYSKIALEVEFKW